MSRVVFALCLLPALSACAGLRPVQPLDPSQNLVAARVVFKGSLPNFLRHPARQIYYARVTERNDLDLDHPLTTNFYRDGYVYWLNAPPGRYEPVAAAYTVLGLRYLGRLDEETRKDMAVELGHGQAVFAGATLAKTDWKGFGQAGIDLLRHAQGFIPFLGRPTVDIDQTGHVTDRSAAAEGEVLRSAARALRGTGWQDLLHARFEELQPPPPVLYRGWVFRKPLPRFQADDFSYVDVIGWGAPRTAADAVEWRERKGRATISAAFLKEADRATKPREAYLADMRAAGSAEDPHLLFEVKVGSRTAWGARYTTYVYPQQDMPGGRPQVLETETILAPDAGGYFLMRYRAKRADFQALLPRFLKFLQYIVFEKKQPGQSQS